MDKGFFIVIDGIDGTGKTIHSKLLMDWLKLEKKVLLTQEPSTNEIGKLIKKFLRTTLPTAVDALLFAADRVLHTIEIKKALDEGKIVISDRYIESSICYQGVELDEEWVSTLNKFALVPDLTIILDIDPEIGLKRKEDTSAKFENIPFLTKVRELFLNRAKKLNYTVITTSKPIEEVQKEIQNYVNALIREK